MVSCAFFCRIIYSKKSANLLTVACCVSNTSTPSAKPNAIDLRIIRSSDYVRRCTPCLMRFSAAFEDSLVGKSFSTPCTVASPRSKVRARPSLREHPLGGRTGFGVFGKFQRPLQMTLDLRQSLARECLEL